VVRFLTTLLLLSLAKGGFASTLQIASFNLESGGAKIEQLLVDMTLVNRDIDVWGFQEVQKDWADKIAAHLTARGQGHFQAVMGKSGGSDRLAIVFNSDKFNLVNYEELADINIGDRVRAPLVAMLEERKSGFSFLFMNNHLYRSNKSARHEQAHLINQWGRQQSLPFIAVGDYNFDYDIATGKRDLGYYKLTAEAIFDWVKPDKLIKTQCSTEYNSILDFIFVGGPTRFKPESAFIHFQEESYCMEDAIRSDHRPLSALFTIN
jgi:endonuclease/exonuclease/phosphatase family metal-dependent hydrolase